MKILQNRIPVAFFVALATTVFLQTQDARAQGDGPLTYQLLPQGTKVLALYGLFTSGNQTADPGTVVKDGEIDVSLGILNYIHTFRLIKDQQAALFATLPFGKLDGSMKVEGVKVSGDSSGISDLQIGGIAGLVGSPSLPAQEYVTFKPGLGLGVLGKVYVPTGEYDSAKALNLGANRWAFQVGLPTTYYLGESLLDPALTTFSLFPSVTVFTDNDDPFNANRIEQAPLFKLEGHITRSLSKMLWVSLDALYIGGGETTTDGVKGGNSQSSLSLGGTVNAKVSRSTSLKFSYGETVSRNDSGLDGSMIRAIINFAF